MIKVRCSICQSVFSAARKESEYWRAYESRRHVQARKESLESKIDLFYKSGKLENEASWLQWKNWRLLLNLINNIIGMFTNNV